jgi:hypothetical protein
MTRSQAKDSNGKALYYAVDENGNKTTTKTTEETAYPVWNNPVFGAASNASKVLMPETYDMTKNRFVVTTDLTIGTDDDRQTSGLVIGNLVIGFRKNGIAIQFGNSGNGHSSRCWNVTSSLKGVNYYNTQACESIYYSRGEYQGSRFNAKWEVEGSYVNVYVNDILVFSADYEVLMTNYTNSENSKKAETPNKVPYKSTSVKFGYMANHEFWTYSYAYAANNMKVTPIAIATDNTEAIATAKANAIAKINAIDVNKLSPAGKTEYESKKQSAIDAITAYTPASGESVTATIGAIEAIAAPVLVTNKDYDVFVAGYGNTSVKWGTVIDTVVAGKTATSFGDNSGYYYNTDGKFSYTAGSLVKGYTRIYPSTTGGRKIAGATEITVTKSGDGRGYKTSETPQYLTNNIYDLNAGTLTMRATYSIWANAGGNPQGVGFQLIQPSTGKLLKITTNYNTTSKLLISAKNSGDGWGYRVNSPDAKTAIDHKISFAPAKVNNAYPASEYGDRELDFQMKITGKSVKIWIGKVGASFNDSNVNYVIDDIYDYYTKNAATQGSDTKEGLIAATPNFADDGNVIVGIPFFHDGNGRLQIRSLNVKFTKN